MKLTTLVSVVIWQNAYRQRLARIDSSVASTSQLVGSRATQTARYIGPNQFADKP